jgi:hypothetical protein
MSEGESQGRGGVVGESLFKANAMTEVRDMMIISRARSLFSLSSPCAIPIDESHLH